MTALELPRLPRPPARRRRAARRRASSRSASSSIWSAGSSDLSKGNKQKVGIVAAFMHDPQLLILDEPTSGLDPLRQQDVLELVRERAAAGRTVFLSSHELDQVEHVAERVGIVRDGRLVAVESIATLKQRAMRRVEVRLAGPADRRRSGCADVPACATLALDDGVVRLHVKGSMDALVKELARLPGPDADERAAGARRDLPLLLRGHAMRD